VPVAVVERGRRGLEVRAASVEARSDGVQAGLRRREAEGRCPGLVVVEADLHVEASTFESVARAVEAFTPRLSLVRPGLLELPTRGPARYFGGDRSLASRLIDAVGATGVTDVRIGIADGAFAARLAARGAAQGHVEVVEPGDSPSFLAPWPVEVLDDPELAGLLGRLGLHTLGAFAGLPAGAVLARFGPDGTRLHRRARGLDDDAAPPCPPPPELIETTELDPPAVHVETAVFVAKGLTDRFLARLESQGLQCMRVAIEAETEHGEHLTRCWRHEGALTAGALAARVRWQLEGWLTGGEIDEIVTAGLILLRLVPDQVVPATGRQLGFWGGDPAAADRAGRAAARVQGILGHPAVVIAVPQGGRTPDERVRWVPWGDPREPARPVGPVPAPGTNAQEVPPWPGALPGPAPARLLDPPAPAELLAADGRPVIVSGRGEASAPPAQLRCPALPDAGGAVTAAAGPWAHDARWWDTAARLRCAHWQVTVGNVRCLVAASGSRAVLTAIYD
jgi:protein ImuB